MVDGAWGRVKHSTIPHTGIGQANVKKTKQNTHQTGGKKNEDNVKHFTHSKGYMNYIENRKISNNPLSASNAHFLCQLVMQGLGMSNVFPKCCSY